MSAAVYSAIYGTYEATAKRLPPDLGIPAILFTDQPQLRDQATAAGWSVIVTRSPYLHFKANPANGDPAVVEPMLAHKYWKTHPTEAIACAQTLGGLELADVDVSIWLDGSMEVNCSGPEFVARNLAALGDDDWSLMPHPWRKCALAEAVYSSTLVFRYDATAMMLQHDELDRAGHPRDWGLFATGHMVRRHSTAVLDVCKQWWRVNVEQSHQDQISLPHLVRLAGETLRWNTALPWAGMWRLHEHGN